MHSGLEGTGTLRASEIAKKVSLLGALHFVKEAWDEVSDVTIRNCFRHGGFIRTKQEDNPDVTEKPDDLSDNDYEVWINVDANFETAEKNYRRINLSSRDESKRDDVRTMTMKGLEEKPA
ncbi:hypothetical protein AVEN_8424-1 [Araneus ventricosus]|uniref:DDE-1 domain-containing protein n=1 Tax=Araneus ventricosus TaxID=182803 RepID=A0A4Y2QPT2_ARAVE|nr:hypothetical protein AVEN_8424-1 [Araneus ventricosus]